MLFRHFNDSGIKYFITFKAGDRSYLIKPTIIPLVSCPLAGSVQT